MNILKSRIFKKSVLYTSVFGLSLGLTFMIAKTNSKPQGSKKQGNDVQYAEVEETTPGQRLIESLFSYEALEFDASVNIALATNQVLNFDLVGQGKISDIENIELLADLSANLDGTHIAGQLGYFTDELTFSMEDICNFRLKTDDLLDFMEMIPTYGVSLELPESLSSLSIDEITNMINAIEVEDRKTTPQGEYYYNLGFGEGEEAFNVMVLTNTQDQFLGIRIDTFYYQGTKFGLSAKLNEITENEYHVVNPLNDLLTASKYQDFKPIFNLFDSFYALTKREQLGVKLSLDLEKKNKDTELFEEVLDAVIDLGIDKNNKVYDINASINENNRNHQASFALKNETIYAKYHNVAISINEQTITDLISFAMSQISGETLDGLMSKLTESASDLDIGELTSKIKNMLKSVSTSENNFEMVIDLAELGLSDSTPITLGVDFANYSINRIYVNRTEIMGFAFDLEVTFFDYVEPTINEEEYMALEPALPLVASILDLLDENQFRIEFDALVDRKDETKRDITIDGGLQFELDTNRNDETNTGYGYGEVTIVDGDGYNHNLKADMKSVEEILFSYNDTLNGKFSIQTLKDLFSVVMDLVENPDDHFMELFGDLLEKLNNSPISKALAGDYGLLLAYDIVDNLSITSTSISFDINFEIFGMDDTSMNLQIDFEMLNDEETCIFKDVKISGLDLGDNVISANIYLKEFDESLDSQRLSPALDYLDFSDIKVLLELGINTSKFNYYHFTAEVNGKIQTALTGLSLISLDIPMDIKIRNDHGDVQVAVEMDIPIVKVLLIAVNPGDYYSAKDRHVSLYYQDGTFYIHRTETVRQNWYSISNKTYDLVEVLDTDYFMDNILTILLKDVIGLSDTIMDAVESSTSSSGDSKQIKYENILKDFQYNKTDHFFAFDIDMNTIANTDGLFTSTTVKILTDESDTTLEGLQAHLGLSVGIKINADITLKFEDDRSVELTAANKLVDMDNFISLHQGDTRNTKIENLY